jgi:TRAP-type mannitol/chloroaromatic compound transport system permease small subunit
VHIKFVDWIPGICSALGMLVINSIEKSRLQADSFSYSGSGVAWKARFVLFLGFALLAGGLAGSVVCICLKSRLGYSDESEADWLFVLVDGYGSQVFD